MSSPSPELLRRPAIVGAAQKVQRVEDPTEALSPLGMMEESLRLAAEDAGAPALLEALDAIYVPQGLWKYGDPGKALAERVGAGKVHTIIGEISGHMVQLMVNRACAEVAAGRHDVVAIVGAESENSKRRIQRANLPEAWSEDLPGEPDERIGSAKTGWYPQEIEAGITSATACFSLCESSLRHSLGETPSAHRDRISALYARLSKIAAANPHAWIQREFSATEIREPTEANRMVGYPYTKLMTSNISVDQGAALIVCSEEAARRYGIADHKKVFLIAATEMSHTTALSEREILHEHPGQVIAARRALELIDVEPTEIPYVDLYSCFPFAIQTGAKALGIGLDPFPSLTGGMTFFGGPLANYVIHSKVHLIEKLRADPGTIGAIGSVGGFFGHFLLRFLLERPGRCAGARRRRRQRAIRSAPQARTARELRRNGDR